MSKYHFFIVIPVHNRKLSTKKCLESLLWQTLSDFHVVVVDDGSTDGTSEMIQQDFPETILLKGDGNLWWTGATNLGVKYALERNADLIVTLNNDVLVKKDYVEKLVEAHRKEPDALIGSINLTQEEPSRLLYAGTQSLNHWTAKSIRRGQLHKVYNGEFSGLLPTYSLPGRGVLIPRKVFDIIGRYDGKHFRHYAADYDFSLRAVGAGFKLLIHMENPVFSPYEPDRVGGDGQSLTAYIKSFFEFQSPNYFPVVFRYNFRHCPHRWYFPIFAILNFGRTFVSFVLRK